MRKKPPEGGPADADTLPPTSGARRRRSAVRRAASPSKAPAVLVADYDPDFRALAIALVDGPYDMLEAEGPRDAAYLCQRHAPDILVTRPDIAAQLAAPLAELTHETSGACPPAVVVVVDGPPKSVVCAGVAALVHRRRLAEDLPDAVARALKVREGPS